MGKELTEDDKVAITIVDDLVDAYGTFERDVDASPSGAGAMVALKQFGLTLSGIVERISKL